MRRSTQGWLDREMCHWDCKQSLGLQTVGKYMSTQCFQKKRATLVAMRFLSSLGEGDTRKYFRHARLAKARKEQTEVNLKERSLGLETKCSKDKCSMIYHESISWGTRKSGRTVRTA
eukprot:1145484-Pelagomonas_calceolata.AAC.2